MTDFRSYAGVEFSPAPDGLTVILGANGEVQDQPPRSGGLSGHLAQFPGVPGEALIRRGAAQAVVRAEGGREGRRVLIEAELRPSGRDRVQVNRQALRRTRDLLGALQVTVFAPDDLRLVKGGPQERRDLLDDLLVALHPRHDAVRGEVERVLRQRGALLRSAGGQVRPAEGVTTTLDVWDAKLAEAGTALVRAREGLVEALGPRCAEAYHELALAAEARGGATVSFEYRRSWSGELLDALRSARSDDLRRGVSTVGPHRDDLGIELGGMPARTHASQGEQRSLALALRLAGHRIVTERIGSAPILLLDDVFSELDSVRAGALLRVLPLGQTLLTSAESCRGG